MSETAISAEIQKCEKPYGDRDTSGIAETQE